MEITIWFDNVPGNIVGENKEGEKEEGTEQDIVEEGIDMNIDTHAPVEDEQSTEQSVPDTLVPSANPPHEVNKEDDTIKI